MSKPLHYRLPVPMSVTGRSSSITNAFINAIIPVIEPTEKEEFEALEVLGIAPNNIRCVYCGDKATEFDHLNPIIRNQEPTGYITEIANLVPSCGKCNQSKGASSWRNWIVGSAALSPKTRNIPDIEERILRLAAYEKWRQPRKMDFPSIVGPELWKRHRQNWEGVLALLKSSRILADEIRILVKKQV